MAINQTTTEEAEAQIKQMNMDEVFIESRFE